MSSSDRVPVMLGMKMRDIDRWSDRVTVALGQNPSAFTGPGTNTYLVGTGPERILLDTGDGRAEYIPVLEAAMEQSGCRAIQEIVLTHGHPDHIGGVGDVIGHFGELRVSKLRYAPFDERYSHDIHDLGEGDVVQTEGASLRALHTPGHAPDHLCFMLEEEQALFTGDNVLGVGTTVIPTESGDLGQYMDSLARLLEAEPSHLYPAHGPLIERGCDKIREYIAHREERERQILAAIEQGVGQITEIVKIIYVAYPATLHTAAGQSVGSHLLKLEAEGRVRRAGASTEAPIQVAWTLA